MLEYLQGIEQLYTLFVQTISHAFAYLAALGIPAPVGAIGLWRWGVWSFRHLIGFFYRPQKPNGYKATTSVITPVYNETLLVFRAALRSWAANHPTEIIAVIDHSDEKCIEEFRQFEKDCQAIPGLTPRLIITEKPGKRPALVDGMLAATGDIVCLVDSDTIWDNDVLVNVLAPFADPKVGGVTTRQNVLWPTSVAQRIFDVYLDVRYDDEVRFLTALTDTPFGDAVTCLSGRTAIYRRTAVIPVLDGLLNETFLGKKVISGDDKSLTLLVQGQGWKVRYQETARVYTPGAVEMSVFLKQRLRWARNSWRADFKALFSRWAWRKPLLALHLIDRLIQPLTTLVAPLYVSFAIFRQHWIAVAVVITWWFLSRCVKLWPHLRRRWWHISILPYFVAFNYWSAVMRIYAFFTMNQQGWITRWNKSRMAMLGPLAQAPSYLATGLTVALVGFGVFYKGLSASNPAKVALPEPAPIVETMSVGNLPSDATASNPLQQEAPTQPTPAQPVQAKTNDWLPSISPNGKQMIIVHRQEGKPQFFVGQGAASQLRRLPLRIDPQSSPRWSPDSRKIAFLAGEQTAPYVGTIDVYTDEQHRWLVNPQPQTFSDFTWSSDSQTILFRLAPSNDMPSFYQKLPILLTHLLPSQEIGLETMLIPATRVDYLTTPSTEQKPAARPIEAQPVPLPEWPSTYKTAVVTTGQQELTRLTDTPSVHHQVLWSTIPTPMPEPQAAPVSSMVTSPKVTTAIYEGTPSFFLLAIVPQDHVVNARTTSDLAAPVLTALAPGEIVQAIGRSSDNDWLQIILPDRHLAWVATTVVTIDTTYLEQLPVITTS